MTPALPARILVVDDESVIRDLFTRVLALKGYTAVCAKSGPEALDTLKAAGQDFLMAFLDIIMPGLDGVETLQEIRALRPDLPVVMMTGYAVEGKIKEAMAAGAFDYMFKPFDIAEIVTHIQKVTKRKALKPLVTE